MFPTFRALDFIEVRPLAGQSIHVGDIILFPAPDAGLPGAESLIAASGDSDSELLVVHRVAAVLPDGLRTRGDHYNMDDPWLVPVDQVVGRVEAAHRGPRKVPIWGGRAGLASLYLRKGLRSILRRARRFAARVLPGRAAPTQYLLALLRPHRAVFTTPSGPVTRLIVGSAVIGEYSPLDQRWRLRAPYRWLIDERGLGWEDQ